MHTKRFIFVFIPIIIAILVIYATNVIQETGSLFNNSTNAENGVLNLEDWDFDQDGIAYLNGEWSFYWNQLLTWDKLKNDSIEPSGYFRVPGVWNDYIYNGKKVGGMGYGTYKLTVKINDKQANKRMGLKIHTMSTSYVIAVNGNIVANGGIVGSSPDTASPEYNPQAVFFYPESDEFDIVIQVSNYTYARGGIWRQIEFGTDKQIQMLADSSSRYEMIYIGVSLIMFVYYFMLFFLLDKKKEMLYAAIVICVFLIRTLVTGEYIITSLIPIIPFSLIILLEYLTCIWSVTIWVLFVGALYPKKFTKMVMKVIVLIAVLMTLLCIFTPVRIYTSLVQYVLLYIIFLQIYVIIKLIMGLIKCEAHSELMLGCSIMNIVLYTVDVLNINDIVTTSISMLGIGCTITLLIQAYILASRYSQSYHEALSYSTQMENMNKAKDEFLAITSHELRTPLNGIISITRAVLDDEKQRIPDSAKKNLELVLDIGQRLSRLVNDLLDFSKMKNQSLPLDKNELDILALVDSILLEMRFKIAEKGVVLKKEYIDKDIRVNVDKNRIAEIIVNLVDNAAKYTPSGGTITVRIQKNKNDVHISVIDNGIGIPKDQISTIFEPYKRLDLSKAYYYDGLGLGLSISQAIAQAHGGSVSVSSTEGKGSEFTLSLPIYSIESKKITQEKSIFLSKQSAEIIETNCSFMGTGIGNIVTIDDKYSNLIGTASILNGAGYTVKGFTNAFEALEDILSLRKTDIVITDLMMPNMSGVEVCQKIREQFSVFELPILVLTARKQGDSTTASLNAGANDVIFKPFEKEELIARVNMLMCLKSTTEKAISNEIAMLQAQINPHFLHNALSALAACSYENGEKAAEAMLSLSDYLQYSFDVPPDTREIMLTREIDLIKAYLSIEKLRFGDLIEYEMHFEDPEKIKIPPYLIQPLVENAVRHGVTKKDEGGSIKISGYREENGYTICVEDSGVGITDDMKRMIQAGEKKGTVGIGLDNVRKRLKKGYGTDLIIESTYGIGTKVSLTIR